MKKRLDRLAYRNIPMFLREKLHCRRLWDRKRDNIQHWCEERDKTKEEKTMGYIKEKNDKREVQQYGGSESSGWKLERVKGETEWNRLQNKGYCITSWRRAHVLSLEARDKIFLNLRITEQWLKKYMIIFVTRRNKCSDNLGGHVMSRKTIILKTKKLRQYPEIS